MKNIKSACSLLVLGLGLSAVASAGDDARPREPVTVSVTITEPNGNAVPIITVPKGKRFVGQAVNCYNAGPRVPGAQCLLQINVDASAVIELPVPPIPYDAVTIFPTVTQVMPFYLDPGAQLVGYCFVTAPIKITVSGYFIKDKE